MPINNFNDPYITCCFVSDSLLFANLFHNFTQTHHQFFYDYQSKILTRHTKFILPESNIKNFPCKCFMSEEEGEIYSFYRQGQSIRVPVQNTSTNTFKRGPVIEQPDYIISVHCSTLRDIVRYRWVPF